LFGGLFSAADESTFKKDPNLGLSLRLLQLRQLPESSEGIGEVPVQVHAVAVRPETNKQQTNYINYILYF